jgi:hypothetical protein
VTTSLIDRRTLLGTAPASILLPRVARTEAGHDPNNQEPTKMRIRMTSDGRAMTATRNDNPSARDFLSMLPLDLTIADFGGNEKIANLPRKLTEKGSGRFGAEQLYDLCYYAPWGNLAIFNGPYKFSSGLIRLGHVDEGAEALHALGEFPLRIEAIS